MPDFRRAQGRKHTIASVLAIVIAARLTGFESGIGAAQFAQALNQTELKALGAWFNPKTKKYEPPSKSVIYRVLEKADPAVIDTVLKRWFMPRLTEPMLSRGVDQRFSTDSVPAGSALSRTRYMTDFDGGSYFSVFGLNHAPRDLSSVWFSARENCAAAIPDSKPARRATMTIAKTDSIVCLRP